jgi:short-subunit dehydrogenase
MIDMNLFAVVTGASSGIGLELALEFARNGYDLLITSATDRIEIVKGDVAAFGTEVHSFESDLSEPGGVEALYQKIKSMGRPLDAIAINAGVGVGGEFARETYLNDELRLIDLNCRSTVHLAKLVIRDMAARKEGKVLFTSSIAATMPGTFEAVYSASKAFVQSFALALHEECKDIGVTVTALMPGPTDTHFFERADMEDTRVGAGKKDDPSDVAKEGFEALMAGKAQHIAGSLKTKIMGHMADVLPENVKAKMHRHLSEPGGASPDQARQ